MARAFAAAVIVAGALWSGPSESVSAQAVPGVECPKPPPPPPKPPGPVKGPPPARVAPLVVPEVNVSCGTSNVAQTMRGMAGAVPQEKDPPALLVLEACLRLLSVLIWPLLILALALVYRDPLTRLIDRMKSLSWGDKGAQFAEEVEAAEDKADIEPSPEAAAVALDRSTLVAAAQNPRGTILSAWLEVEKTRPETRA